MCPSLIFSILSKFSATGKTTTVIGNEYDEDDKPLKPNGGVLNNRTEREILPPPPPLPRKSHVDSREKQGPAVARAEEEDIFVGDGIYYEVPGKDISQSPVSEDMEESPRNKEKVSYFNEPAYGPAPPAAPQGWQDMVS